MNELRMNVWQWGDVKGVDGAICNNIYYYAVKNNIDCMNITELQFTLLKNEYYLKTYGRASVVCLVRNKKTLGVHYDNV